MVPVSIMLKSNVAMKKVLCLLLILLLACSLFTACGKKKSQGGVTDQNTPVVDGSGEKESAGEGEAG